MKEHVVINRDRTVVVPEPLRKIGIQHDHNVNTITFDCPRYPDENPSVDMSKMKVYINYMLADKTLGSFLAENVVVDETDETIMHFDWRITNAVTKVNGVLSTLICVKDTDENGTELYHWNTDLIQRFTIGVGMECLEQVVYINPDVITQLLVKMDTLQSYVNEFMEQNSCIYCWGDSLTQGEGSNIKLEDDVFKAYNLHPYTNELTNYNVVNLGCQGESVNTIMARQGANPMVVSGITIHATKTPVVIGNKTDGIRTVSGDVAKPLNPMEAGINPCYIGGVEGILHRGSSINDSDDNYYFTRLKPGKTVTIESDTIIETFAMRYYRNGIAVIWMGSNGGYKDLSDYITKIKSMVTYGEYASYIVIISREFSGIDVEILKNEFTDANGLCHVINLYEELPLHGLSLANMTHYYFDTSDYANGDEILLKAPILCEYSIVDGSPRFGPLHFSAYGNKAIGKIVSSKLEEVLLNIPKELFPSIPFYETDFTDKYGTVLWGLTRSRSSSGDRIIDTQWKPYDTEKNWTIVMKFTEPLTAVDTYGSIFESRDDIEGTSLFFRKYTNEDKDVYMINMGKGVGFQFTKTAGFFEWVGGEPSTDGYHYLVLSKNGDNYCIFYDGSVMDNYSGPLGETRSDLSVSLFARPMPDGSMGQHSKGIINEFRIYDKSFTASECSAIYSDMVNGIDLTVTG